jgi:hypothetical protein
MSTYPQMEVLDEPELIRLDTPGVDSPPAAVYASVPLEPLGCARLDFDDARAFEAFSDGAGI